MEASALPAPAAVARTRTSIGAPLLRLRSDEQLVALFRAGHDDAFRVIHDRYRQRLFAYTRQMLPHRQDAEDALQDIFVRAYAGLRANHRELALRAWLYRVAHNRCIDELRRPSPPPPEVLELLRSPVHDPIDEADRRESLRRLIADVRRLPEQQRSALLMRELGGMSYADMAGALGVTVPAVKSLLVRARLALGQAVEARDTACSEIREALIVSHDRGLRPTATARRHMRDCAGCRDFRHQLRGVSRRFGAIVPTLGPLGVLANMLGIGGAGSGAAGGALAAGAGAGAGTGSAVVGLGAMSAGATHVATLLAAAVVTAGGAVELQHTITPPAPHHRHHARAATVAPASHHVTQAAATPVTSSSANQTAQDAPAVTSQPFHPQTRTTPVAKTPSAGVPTTVTTSTTTVTVPIKLKSQATGGTSATTSGGGAAPTGTDAGSSLKDPTDGSATTTSTNPSTTSPTTAQTGQPSGSSSSTTQPGSTTTDGPSTSSTSTGGSQTTTTGTGSSTSTTAYWSPPPAP
ncbi:MAG: RNA polymerase sigma factor [Solirubrobacteraceae bacterium]